MTTLQIEHPAFHVSTPGLLTTVQDSGRPGFAAQGVPVGGVMDTWAAQIANLLVGNPSGAAVLEMTLTGPALRTRAGRGAPCAPRPSPCAARICRLRLIMFPSRCGARRN